jgi:hypothetical protein
MRLMENEGAPEEHFTEGEPDLEPPEEMALGELDEEQLIGEELDNEDISEEDVDEDTLEVTLEYLVHQGDPDSSQVPARRHGALRGHEDPEDDEFVCRSCFLVRKRSQLADAGGLVCRECSG